MQINEMIEKIIRKELITALGCTEPIAIAYASAIVRKELGDMPQRFEVYASGDVIKNVKSVIVPNTQSMHGIAPAVIAGALSGDPDMRLEVLNILTQDQSCQIRSLAEQIPVCIHKKCDTHSLYIEIVGYLGDDEARAIIYNKHTNVIHISKNGHVIFEKEKDQESPEEALDYGILDFQSIYDFVTQDSIEAFYDLMDTQAKYNSKVAEIGLHDAYGLGIGKAILQRDSRPATKACAYVAAGSDARMGGCSSAVVINSGSGNQGLAVSLSVYVYGQEIGCDLDTIYRGILLSNLISIYIKSQIGTLSAFCGAVSAGTAGGAAVTFIKGGTQQQISDTIINALSNLPGVICDGAKASCAYKLASSVESGFLASELALNGCVVEDGCGIISSDVDQTIHDVAEIVRRGMQETDNVIIDLMIDE